MKPKVSVIMPSLNVANYIRECIESVLCQSLSNIEILCIDAGSTDGTLEILREYQKEDSRVNVFVSDVKSYGAQVNLGIKLAKGEYISIVETDDYIEMEMFEILSGLADEYGVDYVKADFDSFHVLENGEKYFEKNCVFIDHYELYNRIIDPSQINQLYIYDFNLWKGIYRTSFLKNNSILLNESRGAAYQDIGFTEMVLASARKAYYCDRSFYRYRIGRVGASCGSLYGLKYSYDEFSRLIELNKQNDFIVNQKGFFLHMATSYMGELTAYLKRETNLIRDDELCKCCHWFQKVLKDQVDKGVLSLDDIPEKMRERVNKAIYFPDDLLHEITEEKVNKERQYQKISDKANVIIFGAGKIGKQVHVELDDLKFHVIAFADNMLKGEKILGTPIYGLSDCMNRYPDAIYIIASHTQAENMYEEYLQAGGQPENCIRNWL